jgi:2'-5' RNA ligase
MNYITYFIPNKRLSDAILKQDQISLSSLGLHSTLCDFYLEQEQEENLVSDLCKINFNLFEIKTTYFDNFDGGCLVLRLFHSNELLQLHKNICSVIQKYNNASFSEVAEHIGDNYAPHLTISKSSSTFDRSSKELIDKNDLVSKYVLAKKFKGHWKEIQTFYSGV